MTTTSPELSPVTSPETPDETPVETEAVEVLVLDPRILLGDVHPASELTRLAATALCGISPELYALLEEMEHVAAA